jgi:hypothetical protein
MCRRERKNNRVLKRRVGGGDSVAEEEEEEEVVVKLRRGTSLVFVLKMRSVPFTMQVFLPAIRRGLRLFLSSIILLVLFLLLG